MEFVATATEAEALLLEANLIKRLKPRYNVAAARRQVVSLYPDHRATTRPAACQAPRRAQPPGGYFGPFASAGAVNRTLIALQKAFLLRSCSDSVFANRTRPCLLYQIKRCSAPCVGEISPEDLRGPGRGGARRFSAAAASWSRRSWPKRWRQAARAARFRAGGALSRPHLGAELRQAQQDINPERIDEADVFGLAQEGGQTCVQVFFFRAGQNWGNRAYFPRPTARIEAARCSAPSWPVLRRQAGAALILLSHELSRMRADRGGASTQRSGRKVELAVPQRGEKQRIVEHAADECARGAGPPAGRERPRKRKLLDGVARGLRAGGAAAPHRGLRQFSTSRAAMRSAR